MTEYMHGYHINSNESLVLYSYSYSYLPTLTHSLTHFTSPWIHEPCTYIPGSNRRRWFDLI